MLLNFAFKVWALKKKANLMKQADYFFKTWNEAANDFEKFIAAHYVARHQKNVSDKLKWLQIDLQLALNVNNEAVNAAFPSLYTNIAKCYEELNDPDNAKKNYELANSFTDKVTDNGPFYHGTKSRFEGRRFSDGREQI